MSTEEIALNCPFFGLQCTKEYVFGMLLHPLNAFKMFLFYLEIK